MIARTWHGVTPLAKADEYLHLMRTIAVPDYQAIAGNRGCSPSGTPRTPFASSPGRLSRRRNTTTSTQIICWN
jgi:hypothetical protein